jgi:ketosteroid isomerase-like protein
VSANLDLVRSIYADWERGDFGSVGWADPQIDYVLADGPAPDTWTGLAGMGQAWGDILSVWTELRVEGEKYRALHDERVLVLDQRSGRGKTSEMEIGQTRTRGATLWQVRDGRVTKLVVYWDRDRALADPGLAAEAAA